MEFDVATLVATLRAEVLTFERNMAAADALLATVKDSMQSVERTAAELSGVLSGVKISTGQAADSVAALQTIQRSLSSTADVAMTTSTYLEGVKLGAAQAAETVVNAEVEKAALSSLADQAQKTTAALAGMGAVGAAAGGGGAGVAALLGFGAGTGIANPLRFLGAGGFGLGPRRLFPGMAAFGSLAGLAGFGAERAVTSTLGIAGSIGGGLLGGGLLAAGALGTTAVGMGTDMAGIGQAAGDIKTVSSDLGALNTAIQEYGRNSTQAADAQRTLNTALAGFSPVARGAVLAAAQTSQSFKAMFDQATGQAEKTGAEIINQAMLVGEKFLPTIGQFAAENMDILQHSLQPLFAWLQNSGAQGGLGIFQNLEQVFQNRLPTAIQALTQGFELFVKIIDVAAQQTGGFTQRIDEFFTKWNSAANFPRVAAEVDNLIGLFRTWMGLLGSVIGLLADVFRPAVGFGKQFAQTLTDIINQMRSWLSASGTEDVLRTLFSAHKQQIIEIGQAIQAILPLLESLASAFLQIEAVITTAFNVALKPFIAALQALTSSAIVDKIVGWVGALLLADKAFTAVWTVTKFLLVSIGLMGPATARAAVEMDAALAPVLVELRTMNATLASMGVSAAEGAAGAVAAEESVGAGAVTAAAEVGGLRAALLGLGAPEVLAAIAAAFGFYKFLTSHEPASGGPTSGVVRPTANGPVYGIGKGGVAGVSWTDPQGHTYYGSAALAAWNAYRAANPTEAAGIPAGLRGSATGGTPNVGISLSTMFNLPTPLNRAIIAAEAGHGNLAQANAAAYAYYQHMLRFPGLTTDQRTAIERAEIPFAPQPGYSPVSTAGASGAGTGTVPGLTGPQTQLAQAQAAYLTGTAAGTTPQQQVAAATQYLAILLQQRAVIDHLSGTAKQDLTVQRERLTITRQILAAQKELAAGRGAESLDKLLGISGGGSATQSIQFRLHTVLLDELERLLGGSKANLGVTAQALHLTPSALQSESATKLLQQIKDSGYQFSTATIAAIKKVEDAIVIAAKDGIKFTTQERTVLANLLAQINTTLKGTAGVGTNYARMSVTAMANAIPGLSYAQKLQLEASLSEAEAHGFRAPTGGAAGGYALPKGVGLGYGTTTIHVGTLNITSSARNLDQLAREIRQAQLKTARRNTTQTRGPNAGRNTGLA